MAYDTSYYDDQIKKYNTYADTVAKQQIGDAQKNAQSQLRQAYVQRMQNQQRQQEAVQRFLREYYMWVNCGIYKHYCKLRS